MSTSSLPAIVVGLLLIFVTIAGTSYIALFSTGLSTLKSQSTLMST